MCPFGIFIWRKNFINSFSILYTLIVESDVVHQKNEKFAVFAKLVNVLQSYNESKIVPH